MGIVINVGPVSEQTLQACLDATTAMDLAQWRDAGGFKSLAALGYRYVREPRDREEWLTSVQIRKQRVGAPLDCEDLACDYAAGYQYRGIAARAVWKHSAIGYHIVVRLPGGRYIDPSRMLGM